MKIHRWAAMGCVALATGCQPAAEQTPMPTPSAQTSISFAVVDGAPVIDPAVYGASYLLPGAAVAHDGTYHLYPVIFFNDPEIRPRVVHLTSADGTSWSGDATASVLDGDGIGLDDMGPIPSSAFVADDGTWVMHGGGRLRASDESVLWRATAPGPDGPWTIHDDLIMEREPDGWDGLRVDHPAVVQAGDGYLMAYGGAGRAAEHRGRIGLASSSDGVTWTRISATLDEADDEEALGPSACGVDARTMVEPHLVPMGGGQLLVFGVMQQGEADVMEIHAASSSDATTWTCVTDEGISPSTFAGGNELHSFVAFGDGDDVVVLVEVLGEASSTLWLARMLDP